MLYILPNQKSPPSKRATCCIRPFSMLETEEECYNFFQDPVHHFGDALHGAAL